MAPAQIIANRYQVISELGKGGMGVVYHVKDRLTGEHVALKQVTTPQNQLQFSLTSATDDFRRALAEEFRTLSSLRHPHIISVRDYGFDAQRQPYLVMTLLEKPKTIVEASKSATVADKVRLLTEMLQALAYLHRQGIIHRDLKPDNALVTTSGEMKVLDFGLAIEQGKEEEAAGTLAYMAPEIFYGQPATVATDLYAVGIMAYEVFTGQHPFDPDNPSQLIQQILTTTPDLSAVPDHFGFTMPENNVLIEKNELPDTPTVMLNELPDTPTVMLPEAPAFRVIDEHMETVIGAPLPEGKIPQHETQINDENVKLLHAESKSLRAVIEKLLVKDPNKRYQDAYAVIDDLSAATMCPVPEESVAIRTSFLQAAKFVGRDTELQQLVDALNIAIAGTGSSWLVGGESGVGKSRLLDELRTRALVKGVFVLRGQSPEGGSLPYQLWHDVLRRAVLSVDLSDMEASILKEIVPDIAHLLERDVLDPPQMTGKAAQERLAHTIGNVFRKQTIPILLILEDLQWADESLEPLKHLNRISSELPILIVGNYRDDEQPDLPQALPEMSVLKLTRFGADNISALSESMLGKHGKDKDVLDLLQRETEGNVFFLVEVVRVLAEEAGRLRDVGKGMLPKQIVAGGIQQIIQRRLDRISEKDRRLLNVAAIAGRLLDLDVLRLIVKDAIMEIDIEDWLITCANVAVLDIQESRWRFAHDKIRDALVADLLDNDRKILHRQVAEAIESIHAGDVNQVGMLAEHWRGAENIDKERHYAHIAGELAHKISAFREAIKYFARALEISPQEDEKTRAALFVKLGRSYEGLSDYPSAKQSLNEGLLLAEKVSDQEMLVLGLRHLAIVAIAQGNYEEAQTQLNTGLTFARNISDHAGIAACLSNLGIIALDQGDYIKSEQHYVESLEIWRSIGDQEGEASCLNNLGNVAERQGQYETAQSFYEKSLAIFKQLGNRARVAGCYNNLGVIALYRGDFEIARGHFEESMAISKEIDDQLGIAFCLGNMGFAAEQQQDFETARRYYEESLGIRKKIGDRLGAVVCLYNLGDVAANQGDSEVAWRRYCDVLEESLAINATPFTLDALRGIARLQAEDNHSKQAAAWIGLVLNHPAIIAETKEDAQDVLTILRGTLSEDELDMIVNQGKSLDLDDVVAEILSKRSQGYRV